MTFEFDSEIDRIASIISAPNWAKKTCTKTNFGRVVQFGIFTKYACKMLKSRFNGRSIKDIEVEFNKNPKLFWIKE